MNAQLAEAETIYVSKLIKTETLEHGRVRQVFDIIGLPGLQVVCISRLNNDEEFEQESQEYRLANGEVYPSIDDALLAWDDLAADLAILDALAAALLRLQHGLIRPLWEDRSPRDKEPWLTRARQFKQTAESLGLSICRPMVRQ